MKIFCTTITAIAIGLCAGDALARDDIKEFSIADALATEQAKSILGDNVKFYFGNQAHGAVNKKFGEYGSNKKTNAFGKSSRQACEWAFLSALKSLREKAERQGANAVVNIRSNYKSNTTSSNETFKCGSGAVVAGVALLGETVEIK